MKTICIVISLFLSASLHAQSGDLWLISSFGLEFKDDNYLISSSAGEFVIETFQSEQFIVTQGFHQTFDLGTYIAEITPEIDLLIYPNPFSDAVLINIKHEFNGKIGQMEIRVTDLLGRLTYFDKAETYASFQHQINTQNWIAGLYFLNIRFNHLHTEKTFKLIKK